MRSLVIFALLVLVADVSVAQVYVRGYYRSDGTYVEPHYRSEPDGNFYNNWSTKGNVNPYTGEEGTKVTPPSEGGTEYESLRHYYESSRTTQTPSDYSSEEVSSRSGGGLPDQVYELPELTGRVSEEDISRADAYCASLYSYDEAGRSRCKRRQRRALASITIPNYSDLPERETSRSALYCENLYGNDRAGFYNCLNRQIFSLNEPKANFREVPSDEVVRSKRYCENLYGNDRGGYFDCLRRQASSLRENYNLNVEGLPNQEWAGSERYCENLYGNDRGGAASCKARQAKRLKQHLRIGTFSEDHTTSALRYCGRLYNDDRAGYWSCLSRR